jgi:hypothetical protein
VKEAVVGDSDQEANYGSIARLATLSPVRPERLDSLYRRLAFVASFPGVGRPLLDVATIHYARWIVLGSLPHPDGSKRRWPLNWNYLLFAATYDGPRDVYLNTFADVLPLRLAALFGNCFGFESRVQDAPGADGRAFPAYAFRDFVMQNRLCELQSHDYFTETVRTIRQALAIERTVRRRDRWGKIPLARVQSEVTSMALGPPPTAPGVRDAVGSQWTRIARRGHLVNPLTVVAPLARGWSRPLGRLSELPDTLFARLVLIPSTIQQQLGQQHPDRLLTDYLLFMSDYYGKRDDYIETLRNKPDVEAIFGQCNGFPGVRGRYAFHDWISSHSLKTRYYVTGYAAPPVKDLGRLLDGRARIARWSLGELGADTLEA